MTSIGVPACTSALVTSSLTSSSAASIRSSRPVSISSARTSRRASPTLDAWGGSVRCTPDARFSTPELYPIPPTVHASTAPIVCHPRFAERCQTEPMSTDSMPSVAQLRRGERRARDVRRGAAVLPRPRRPRRGGEVRRPLPRPGDLLAALQPAGARAGRGPRACRCWSGSGSWRSSPATSTSSSWSGWPASSAGSPPGVAVRAASGLLPREVLEAIWTTSRELMKRHASLFRDEIVPGAVQARASSWCGGTTWTATSRSTASGCSRSGSSRC